MSKSVLIFSNKNDTSTIKVTEWLKSFKQPYILIENINGFIEQQLLFNNTHLKNRIKSIWFRKFDLSINTVTEESITYNHSIKNFLYSELNHILISFPLYTKDIRCLGVSFRSMDINKILTLETAKKSGLNVPEYEICTTKTQVLRFLKKSKAITKPIFNSYPIMLSDLKIGLMYTKEITTEICTLLPDVFFPSFIQKAILKEYELRIFYLDKNIYCGAIFSTNDTCNFDHRSVENDELKIVPYDLDINIRKKIITLMKNLNLNTGSIDMIKSKNGDYYFLEVNPCGQYEALSSNCNFKINERIAKWLVNQ